MDNEDKLTYVRKMVGGTDSDEVLLAYLQSAAWKIINKAYPFDPLEKDVPCQYDLLQCEIATYMLSKRGAEGQTAHSENGINRTYENGDVPESMLKGIVPCCGVIL